MNYRQIACELLITGVQSVRPDRLIKNAICCSQNSLIIHDQIFSLSEIRNIYVIGAGKASALMAQSLEAVLGSIISGGHVVTKYGHSIPLKFVEVSEAGHPVPDENGLKSTARIVSIVQKAGENDLVICLLSGGGSSLLTDVPETMHTGRSCNDKQSVVEQWRRYFRDELCPETPFEDKRRSACQNCLPGKGD